MANDLEKYNIIPNKTTIYEPVILQHDLMNHFFRGYFDGDGCLTVRNKKYECPSYYRASIAGFKHNLIKMAEYLDSMDIHLSFQEDKRMYNNGLPFGCIATCNKQQTYSFLKYIYNNCFDVYLPRKKEIADKFFNVYSERRVINEV